MSSVEGDSHACSARASFEFDESGNPTYPERALVTGSHVAPARTKLVSPNGVSRKRTMSAAGRARISKLTKERWRKFRAEKAKRAK
jgi:hypothetical protein